MGRKLHGRGRLLRGLQLQDEGVFAQLGSFDYSHVKDGFEVALLAVGIAHGGLVEADELRGGGITLKRLKTGEGVRGDSSLSLNSGDSGFLVIRFFLGLLVSGNIPPANGVRIIAI